MSKRQNINITQKEISDYLNRRMSPSEEHAFEEAMQNDPFLAEAVEGFNENPSGLEFEAVEQNLKKDLGFGGAKLGQTVGLLLLVSVLGIFMWWQFQEKPTAKTIAEKSKNTSHSREAIGGAGSEEQQKVLISSDHSDSSMSFTFRMEEPNKQEEEEMFVKITSEMVEEKDIPSKVEKTHNFDSAGFLSSTNTTSEVKKIDNSPGNSIYHIEDYKVVDYRHIREERMTHEELLQGLPPNTENPDNKSEPLLEKQMKDLAYVDFLEQAMNDFARHNFEGASKRFKKILDRYPEDANALFYGGMSFFKMEEFSNAKVHFEKSLNSDFSTFHEESEFYLAKTYFQLGLRSAAKERLVDIAGSQSFYRERAKEELEKF